MDCLQGRDKGTAYHKKVNLLSEITQLSAECLTLLANKQFIVYFLNMKIIMASNNRNKLKELSEIVPEHNFVLPADEGIDFDFDETGSTYLENSLGKAKALYSLLKIPVIADDSGLSVPALGGEPGIYSARYGSEEGVKLSDADRNNYLLKKMEGIENREAFFVCSMVFVINEYKFFTAQETVEGVITRKPAGENGFGYDPLFYIKEFGRTAAELTPEEKHSVSHRGKAGRVIAEIIKKGEF